MRIMGVMRVMGAMGRWRPMKMEIPEIVIGNHRAEKPGSYASNVSYWI
jgi:hypothetical protein